jgi:hypothetical protein
VCDLADVLGARRGLGGDGNAINGHDVVADLGSGTGDIGIGGHVDILSVERKREMSLECVKAL